LRVRSDALVSLSGLDAVWKVGGNLDVSGCTALERLAGLGALQSLGRAFTIRDNPALPQCEANSLLQRLRDGGYSGTSTTQNNGGSGTCP
jgi:hypothetical protein